MNLIWYFQNLGDKFSFFLLNLFGTDTREIGPLIILLLIEYLILLEDLKFREIKSFKSADLKNSSQYNK